MISVSIKSKTKLRYNQIKMGYQIGYGYWTIKIFEISCPKLFCLSFSYVILYRNLLEHESCLRMSPLNWNISQPSKR